MANKPVQNNLLITVVVTALVAGVVGYYIGTSNTPFSKAYMNGTATMMQGNGTTMTQMGKMMMAGGSIMQQKGEKYGDTEMMQQGKELETNGSMMQNQGSEMTERSNGMTQMMGQ